MQAVRQRYAAATGQDIGAPKPSKKPRFKAGGTVDKTSYQTYGSGYRKAPTKK